jgi:hypothetical protein
MFICEIQKFFINEDDKFKENYDKLMIVNPSKKKFEDTVLNETHYDLLRIYNNELEETEPCNLMILNTGISEVFS